MTAQFMGPAELTLRVGIQDELVVRRLYGLAHDSSRAPHRPARLVVDAHVPLSQGGRGVAAAARQAGVPLLVDPETYFLQDQPHAEAPWRAVPYGTGGGLSPGELMSPTAQAALAADVIDYQLAHGATAIIAPYVHIDRPMPGWPQVQAGLWRRAREHLDAVGIRLPVIAVVAIGWRCLHPRQGVRPLRDLWTALDDFAPDEVALAASKVHGGRHPGDRIAELLLLVENLAARYPKVTMWQQGLLGEACVIQGAAGYESGIGWRDKCDLQGRKAKYRRPGGSHPGPQPVFLRDLGCGVSKRRLELARGTRRIWSRVVCPNSDCCAPGGDDLVGDARRHGIITRARGLARLAETVATRWRWNYLADRTAAGVDLADQLNALAPASPGLPGVEMVSLRAIHEIANARRGRPGIIRQTA